MIEKFWIYSSGTKSNKDKSKFVLPELNTVSLPFIFLMQWGMICAKAHILCFISFFGFMACSISTFLVCGYWIISKAYYLSVIWYIWRTKDFTFVRLNRTKNLFFFLSPSEKLIIYCYSDLISAGWGRDIIRYINFEPKIFFPVAKCNI